FGAAHFPFTAVHLMSTSVSPPHTVCGSVSLPVSRTFLPIGAGGLAPEMLYRVSFGAMMIVHVSGKPFCGQPVTVTIFGFGGFFGAAISAPAPLLNATAPPRPAAIASAIRMDMLTLF